ncbi:NAD(P)H-dependent oxidoreductase [Costertonia aggregata]|uniref:NAD(P)H-dependent oxidoreductase n=1 Tax=Costertonia aggregata TaxID=343403 RepID=A0A7H9ALB8_9FLAO|nr:NAD(P)H-dependent oxidoreductase [Costertonia aggregata]QLG44256.1 NAD(P)H-dependent oxidoreductase [Costertonia aggregata]
MNNYIKSLEWRYATKKFDTSKKVSDEDLNILLKSIQLSASSYGLQPYEVFIVTDREIRKKLQPVSWGQAQIIDASHVLVFANKTQINADWIDGYLENISKTRDITLESLSPYGDFMKSKVLALSPVEQAIWTSKQTYIALSNLLSAAADLKIDTCPMEGFEADAYNEILGLSQKGLNAALVAPIGYRALEDDTQHYPKVRQSKEKLFTHI